MHVDGFRFDLASILSRDEPGIRCRNPPVLWDIESDPVLAGTKLIAEAWDPGGLYQVGTLHWRQLAGVERPLPRRRPPLREGDAGMASQVATRLSAAPTSTATRSGRPEQSINFVTCHDGFTLNDLVSYNDKHNEANGEDNRDGANDNRELELRRGGTDRRPGGRGAAEPPGEELPPLTLLSLGTPMLLMGDEVRRTQRGTTTPTARTRS